MNIAFICGREGTYPRNQSVLRALMPLGTVYATYPHGGRLSLNLAQLMGRLLVAPMRRWDVCFIGFYGQPLVLATRLRWHGPLVFDAFLSTYDTYCFDRKVFAPDSPIGRIAFWLDKRSCELADIVVLDTWAHLRYFRDTFAIPADKMRVLYAGCDETLFCPRHLPAEDPPIVLFYGTFLPLHGIEVIVRAAHILRGENVRFRIVGHGRNEQAIRSLTTRFSVENIEFLPPVAFGELPELIAHSTICLGGHFGASEKAGRVIGAKTFQCMAMSKPTIVGDNSANRELFTHGRDAWMVKMNDPDALAEGVRSLLSLSDSDRAALGTAARETVVRAAGNAARRAMIAQIVQDAVHANAAR
jgi:glycosyltransferase involved in cell wall biosynthesis